jgi:hypothetical protein
MKTIRSMTYALSVNATYLSARPLDVYITNAVVKWHIRLNHGKFGFVFYYWIGLP